MSGPPGPAALEGAHLEVLVVVREGQGGLLDDLRPLVDLLPTVTGAGPHRSQNLSDHRSWHGRDHNDGGTKILGHLAGGGIPMARLKARNRKTQPPLIDSYRDPWRSSGPNCDRADEAELRGGGSFSVF